MNTSFILATLLIIAEFGLVKPNPLQNLADHQNGEVSENVDDDGEVRYDDGIAWYDALFEATESTTESENVTIEIKESTFKDQELFDISGFTKWLVDKNNSNAKSFVNLLNEAWKIVQSAPWSELDGSTTTRESEGDSNVGTTMNDGSKTSTSEYVHLYYD